MGKTIKLGGASGYWGESDMAWGQLLAVPDLDYLVFDYLAEITMSLLARMRARDASQGYATDFVTQLSDHLPTIAERGVRIVSNAGGVNPEGCAAAVRAAIAGAGLSLSVAVITGDELMDRLDALTGTTEMFTGEPMPDADSLVSANAYLGAFPIADALGAGADIVITGRVVDSAVTLGALIHEFGWTPTDLDRLAQGSLVGHLIECGPQVTGGNYTDWETVSDTLADIGYPVAEVSADGACVITKPAGTGGTVTRGTVAEQMLYEIGDPATYILPDVICDFTSVEITEIAPDRVAVSGARGRGVPSHYKASLTVADGHRIAVMFFMVGRDARAKAQVVFDAVLSRARRKLAATGAPDFTHTSLECIGDDTHYGGRRADSREIAFRLSVRHVDARACAMFAREAMGFALATPPGLSLYTGARSRPQPVTRLFSTLVDKSFVGHGTPAVAPEAFAHIIPPASEGEADTTVPLEQIAFLRSGDKGDMSNIGVIARSPALLPWIWDALCDDVIRAHFAHLVEGDIARWYLPGSASLNILMDRALGGGGMASLRNDPQGKGFGQVLASLPVRVPQHVLDNLPQSRS